MLAEMDCGMVIMMITTIQLTLVIARIIVIITIIAIDIVATIDIAIVIKINSMRYEMNSSKVKTINRSEIIMGNN